MRRLGKWIWVISGITLGSIALLAGLFVLALLLIKLVWAWAMPDLLPGAVDQGLVAKSLSWYAAFKLAVFVALLGAMARSRKGRHS